MIPTAWPVPIGSQALRIRDVVVHLVDEERVVHRLARFVVQDDVEVPRVHELADDRVDRPVELAHVLRRARRLGDPVEGCLDLLRGPRGRAHRPRRRPSLVRPCGGGTYWLPASSPSTGHGEVVTATLAPGPPVCRPRAKGVSAALQVPLALPGVDDRVVGLLLDPRGVQVVVDDVLAEDLAAAFDALELADRLVERPRHARARRSRRSRCP